MTNGENVVGLSSAIKYMEQGRNPYQDESLLKSLVREALIEGGLGQQDPAVPLKDIIEPRMTVLLKPNWVLHENMSGKGMDCMVTHPTFILAALREVVAARPGKIIIGDAPIQCASFSSLATDEFRRRAQAIAGRCDLSIVDFRRDVFRSSGTKVEVESEARSKQRYIEFDLGAASLLEELSDQAHRFRCTCYDPRDLAKTHAKGKHQYLLCREAFEADVILNLPKLKTHRKVGVTGAIKNIVGINGSKAYLPHHRVGGSTLRGDCYRGLAPLKRVAEFFTDRANRNIGAGFYSYWLRANHACLALHRRLARDTEMEGGWSGNDTSWRMVLDLNRLLLYGRVDGSLSENPLRTVFSLTDAIVAGECFGPLEPEPISLGAVTFARSSAFAELCHAALMHFDWKRIKLIAQAFGRFPFPLTKETADSMIVRCRGKELSYQDVMLVYGQSFEPPRGWVGDIEMASVSTEPSSD